MKRRFLIPLAIAIILAAGAGWWLSRGGSSGRQYRTVKAVKGDVVQTVNATGQVKPITLVQVGTQVSGPVIELRYDYNDRVEKGKLVAQIDPAVYKARVAENAANLALSKAGVVQARARLLQADKELARTKKLADMELASQSDLDAAIADRDVLAAQLEIANAQVSQSEASLQMSQTNLDYTSIHSPVDGRVISRNVDVGQTVVASLSAQTIFTIADDLSKIRVEASVPEADIGSIRVDQAVTFTVDAYDQEFRGRVSQVRLASTTVQNVVTYPVIVEADNPGERLFPGMTANLSFEVARREGVLKIPNAALRFKPNDTARVSDAGGTSGGLPVRSTQTGTGGGSAGNHASGERTHRKRTVWVQQADGSLKGIPVVIGISDGIFTEATPPDRNELKEGDEVITGLMEKGEANTAVNPFAPARPGPGRPR